MKKLIIISLILITTNTFAQQKFALVVGNGNYTSFGSLPNALNDANDMAAVLQDLGFTVDKVLDGNRAEMTQSITRLRNRLSISKNSYGFFFYAGHGIQYNGVNYLIPSKADIPNSHYLGDTSISVQTLLAELNDAGNELNVIVLDACRDFPAAWSRTINRGLTVVSNQPADSIIVYATSAGSTAADGTGRNGLFTRHLLTQLKVPGHDVKEVFDLTGEAVSRESNRQQIPAIYSQYFGKVYLGTQPVTQPIAQPAAQPITTLPIQPAPPSVIQPELISPVPEQFDYEGFIIELVGDSNISIKKYTGNAETLDIPDNIKGLPITVIGEKAFAGCRNLKNISIPSSVTTIEVRAFWDCSSLTGIDIPSSVTDIKDMAFFNCSGMKNITIPSSVTAISERTFSGCTGLTNVIIPSSVAIIGKEAFAYCLNLASVSLSRKTKLGAGAFPRGVKKIYQDQ